MNTYQLPSFDEMRELAEKNPEAFEKLREAAIEATISEAPEEMQPRLRGLQFQMNADRDIADNPMDSMIKSNKRMMESFNKLKTLMETWEMPADEAQEATILEFRRQSS